MWPEACASLFHCGTFRLLRSQVSPSEASSSSWHCHWTIAMMPLKFSLMWKINTGKMQLLRTGIPYTRCYLDFLSERRINWVIFKNFLQNAGLVGCLRRAWSTHLCGESRHKSFPAIADLLTHSSALLLTYFQLLPCMLTFNLGLTIINH